MGSFLYLFRQEAHRVTLTGLPSTSSFLFLRLGIWRLMVREVTRRPIPRGTRFPFLAPLLHISQTLDITKGLKHNKGGVSMKVGFRKIMEGLEE